MPVIGNALDMPTVRPWERYREWCEAYKSSLVFLQLPMQPMMVVGSAKVAMDLMEKKSQLYSDRFRCVMFELVGCDFHFSLMPYTPFWRAHRRTFHQHFQPSYVPKYLPLQLQYARRMLGWVRQSPEYTRQHIRRMVTSFIFDITYGKKITGLDDEYVTMAQTALEGISEACIPGIYWVEYLPFLRYIPSWLPGTVSRRLGDKFSPFVLGMRDKPWSEVKAMMDKGTAPPSIAASLIEDNRSKYGKTKEEAEYDLIAKNVAGVTYAAGADTTTSSSQFLMLAMALFPDVQLHARAELDRVVGPSRLPEHDDLQHLPYIRAIVLETLRWMPVAPFAIPHCAMADDTYEGYHIPKGTTLIPNVWAMLRDPEDYSEPDLFNPGRFIGKDGELDPNVRDPTTIVFGFGRRICPGRHVALAMLSIYAASILHVYDITPGLDASGKPIELSTDTMGALIIAPRDVPVGLKPRSQAAEKLISEAAAEYEAI
ncbi:hypothetical protein EIP91_001598 [Steccherinum ochraceum]|uniref:Cytochrome P450 n=1 Tax=Steccherinum ochraceum TaxID=92696 RepID=A0A4R0RM75_9APHY|nr:hypothetical protein EIP91_001598 [Steccherinum ochraceum]